MSDQNCKTYSYQNEENNGLLKPQFSYTLSYEDEWCEFFRGNEIDLEKLKEKSAKGILKSSHFRSIYWRILLGILHKQPVQWLCQLQIYRKHYDDILTELDHNPWNKNIPSDNPLSQDSESIWQKYFCDEELKNVIFQDVKRTFPEIEYFRNEKVQKIMVRILFCYARQNPSLCYKQGMHEILAPLILVLCSDHEAFQSEVNQNPQLEKAISDVLCPEFLEHDAYCLFKSVMNHIQYSYKMKEEQKSNENEIISRLDYIKKNLLIQNDSELCWHLEKLDIPLHLFGIRWLRLLFGGEFQLHELLILWDFIFASNFECINYLFVSMLVAIRQILLKGDYNTCLSILMKYPSYVNVMWIIAYAQHLSDAVKYSVPVLAQFKTFAKKQLNESHETKRLTSNSPTRQSNWYRINEAMPSQEQSGPDDDFIIHSYIINDSNCPKNELEQIKMALSIVHHKLLYFHSLLQTKLQNHNSADIEFVINGIYEISCFLKKYDTWEVETACEAGEIKIGNSFSVASKEKKNEKVKELEDGSNSDKKFNTLPKTKKRFESGELRVFKCHRGGNSIIGAPMTDPLHLIKNLEFSSES